MAGKSCYATILYLLQGIPSPPHYVMFADSMLLDEVRRSGRATKGQHTKNVDEPDAPTPKRGKAGRPAKAKKQASIEPVQQDEDEGPAIIRCICGYVEEDEDDERTMVICDNCSAWQHNICMGISENAADLPEHYFCEQCKPEDHRELLAAVARGEKPWEEREAQRQREEEEKKGRKRKGGKKGKRGRPSEVRTEKVQDQNGAPKSPEVVPPVQQINAAAQPEVGQKRKLPTELDISMTVSEGQVCLFFLSHMYLLTIK